MENENSQIPVEQNISQTQSSGVPHVVSTDTLAQAEAIAGSSPKSPFYKNKKILIIVGVIALIAILITSIVAVFALKSKPKTITLGDKEGGSTIHIKPNDTVVIKSEEPDDMDVGTGISNPNVLKLNGKNHGPSTGQYNGKFTAINSGETDVIVTAAPVCKPGFMCSPLQVLVYKVHIVVDK